MTLPAGANRFSILTEKISDAEDLRIEMEGMQAPDSKIEQTVVSRASACGFPSFLMTIRL